jgi:hypothetical protein
MQHASKWPRRLTPGPQFTYVLVNGSRHQDMVLSGDAEAGERDLRGVSSPYNGFTQQEQPQRKDMYPSILLCQDEKTNQEGEMSHSEGHHYRILSQNMEPFLQFSRGPRRGKQTQIMAFHHEHSPYDWFSIHYHVATWRRP